MNADTQAFQLKLSGDVNIYAAAEIFESVRNALHEGAPVDVDLGEVSELDSVGVQQLLLLARECRNKGLPMRIVATSPAVDEVMNLLDLRPQLQA